MRTPTIVKAVAGAIVLGLAVPAVHAAAPAHAQLPGYSDPAYAQPSAPQGARFQNKGYVTFHDLIRLRGEVSRLNIDPERREAALYAIDDAMMSTNDPDDHGFVTARYNQVVDMLNGRGIYGAAAGER